MTVSGEHITILGVLPLVMFIFTGLRLSFPSGQSDLLDHLHDDLVGRALFATRRPTAGLLSIRFLFALINVLGMFCAYTITDAKTSSRLISWSWKHSNSKPSVSSSCSCPLLIPHRTRQSALLQERFDEEWRRATRDGTPISVLLLDVDEFKAFNDNYGTKPETAACLSGAGLENHGSPLWELAARYGGEEFILLFPRVSHEEALKLGENSASPCRSFHSPRLFTAAKVVTASIGVATRSDASWRLEN